MGITCGVDWTEDHHDVVVMDDLGMVLEGRRIDAGVDGYADLLAPIADHGVPRHARRSPWRRTRTSWCSPCGLRASPSTRSTQELSPATANATIRLGRSPTTATPPVLAEILRTDRHQHRPLPATSDHALTIKALARQHQEAIWALHQTTSRLRSMLLEFYPQALKAFPNLNHKAALTILAAVPTPTAAQRMTSRRVVALLHRCGRRNDQDLVARILTELKAPALRQPPSVEEAMGLAAKALIDILTQMHARCGQPQRRARRAVLPTRAGTSAHLGTRARDCARRKDPRRSRRRPGSVQDPGKSSSVRRHGARHASIRAIQLRQSPQGPQQTTRRRMPLVGVLDPDQESRCPRPLRPSPDHRRHPQRRVAEPGEQVIGPTLVVHPEPAALGRVSRLADGVLKLPGSRRLTLDWRGMSTSAAGQAGSTSPSSSTSMPSGSSPGTPPRSRTSSW